MIHNIELYEGSSHDEAIATFDTRLGNVAIVLIMRKIVVAGQPGVVFLATAHGGNTSAFHTSHYQRAIGDCRIELKRLLGNLPAQFVKEVLFPVYSEMGKLLGIQVSEKEMQLRAITLSPSFALAGKQNGAGKKFFGWDMNGKSVKDLLLKY